MGWLGEKKLSSVMLIIAAVILIAVAVGLLGYLLLQDVFAFGAFPAGTKVVGVSVAGLSKTEAVEKCRDELAGLANKPLTLEVGEDTYQATPAEIGLKLEYDKMVDTAYREAWSVNIFERMFRRFTNRPKDTNISLMQQSDQQMLTDFINRALGQINRDPHDAYVDVTSGAPVMVKAKTGRKADYNQLLEDSKMALATTGRTVKVKAETTPAAVDDTVYSRFLVLNLAAHTLTLYDREQPVMQYPVACGSSSFPTSPGHWKLASKEKNPTWRNPGSAWAKSMPKSIPPGPGNPLGTRAMGLNARGEFIHGTPNPWSVGRSVSHGCIRMYMKDVEQLFDMVEVGTHVFIIKGPGDPGWDVTATPTWMKK